MTIARSCRRGLSVVVSAVTKYLDNFIDTPPTDLSVHVSDSGDTYVGSEASNYNIITSGEVSCDSVIDHKIFIATDQPSGDLTFTQCVKGLAGTGSGSIFRYTDDSNFLNARVTPATGAINILEVDDGNVSIIASGTTTGSSSVFQEAIVICNGTAISLEYNGLTINGISSVNLTSGKIGFRNLGGLIMDFAEADIL